MKKLFIVANWKLNKTESEAKKWIYESKSIKNLDLSNKKIILCPSYVYLPAMKTSVKEQSLPIELGAQDVSSFKGGSYTGEVSAAQVKEFAEFVIIGHSERRINFKETDEMLFKKFKSAKESGLTVIYCVQGKETKIPENVDIVAYEPVAAIGTGNPDTPENAESVAAYFKANFQVPAVLYGGSVTANNVNSFTRMPSVDGVLVGKASLDPEGFYAIIQNA